MRHDRRRALPIDEVSAPLVRQRCRRRGSLAAEIPSRGSARRVSWRIPAGDRSRVLEAAGGSLAAITGGLEDARAIASLDAPRQAPRDPLRRNLRREAAE